jgi:UDP-N-acetylglucosamine kinase
LSDIDPRRYLLSEAAARRIFEERVVPRELAVGTPQAAPHAVFVGGQPGAGKTLTARAVVDRLRKRGTSIVVNSDFYKPFHPEYRRLLAEDDKTAAAYISLDGRRWKAMAEQYLRDRRVDVVSETTMRDPGDFLEPARVFDEAGYQSEAVIIAVPQAMSRLGIVARYHEQVQATGHGRLTLRANHDGSYAGLLHAAREIDEHFLVDRVAVIRRGNELLYSNEPRGPGQWKQPPGTVAAIDAERSQTWSIAQAQRFLGDLQRLGEQLGTEWQPELRSIRELATAHLPPGVEAAMTAEANFPGRAEPSATQATPQDADSARRNERDQGPDVSR